MRRDGGAFLAAAHQHGDVVPAGALRAGLPDGLHDRRELVFAEAHAHAALLRVVLLRRLLHVGVDVAQAQHAGGVREEAVVEADHGARAAPVALQGHNLGVREGFLHLATQQFPVGIAPAVDALLDVAHDQVAARSGLAFLQQRQEILPLDAGRVLELVEQEMLVAHAQLLIDERGAGAADDVAQERVGLVQAHHVLLGRQGVEFAVEFARQAQLREQRVKDQGRGIVGIGVFEMFRQRGVRLEQAFLVVGAERLALLHGIAELLRLVGEGLDDGAALLADPLQAVLAEGLPPVDAQALGEFAEFVVLEQAAHFQQAFVHLEAAALLERVGEAVAQPAEQFLVVLGQRVQDAVHRLGDQRILVQFHLVVRELADLAGEGLERLLEEAVDGADREGAVVVQQLGEQDLRPGVGRGQPGEVAQDAGLHLGGGLVGEGHREDMAVRLRLAACEQQVDIGLGQLVGLARSGAGFQNLHRPQMFLKSHHWQVFASSVRLNGTDRSAISASRPSRRSAIRERKRPLSETLSTSLTKSREVW